MARVLVIDDEEDIRSVLKQVLEREGHEVSVAADGAEGMAHMQAHGADIVITDIIMPGIDGVASLQQIKKKWPNVPVVVISGGGNVAPKDYEPGAIATSAYLASAQNAGADVTLTKPFERRKLIDTLNEVLEGRD